MDITADSREKRFVDYVLRRCSLDKGFAARLRRADNPDTEFQSWGILASWGVNLEHAAERLPFVLVAASLARLQGNKDGACNLGKSLWSCGEMAMQGENGNDARLRRLLACDTVEEVCTVLRPLLAYVGGKAKLPLSHEALLRDLLWFPARGQQVKLRWAQEYYASTGPVSETAYGGEQ